MNKVLNLKFLLFLSVTLEGVLLYLYYFPEPKLLLGDELRYLETGLAIASGGDWHNHPFWPPMQSVLIAVFTKLFTHPILPLQLFQYGLLLLSGFIVKDIVFKETENRNASLIALAVMILFPSWLAYSQYLWPEVIHVTLFVAIIWINRYKNKYYRWMIVSGLLLGLAILFKSLLVLFVPFLYYPLLKSLYWKKNIPKVLISVLVAGLVMAPASIKSHKMTGSWMVANSSMFNLYLGLDDDTRQHFTNKKGGRHYNQYLKSADTFKKRNVIVKQKAMNKINEDGYINTFVQQLTKQYFRLFDYQSTFSQQFQNSKNKNFVNKYQHRNDTPLVTALLFYNTTFYCIIFLAMVFGLMVSVKKSIIAQQLTLFLLYVLGLFLLLHTIPRFRIPLLPVMAFSTGYLYWYVANKTDEVKQSLTLFRNWLMLILIVLSVLMLIFSANLLDNYYPI